MISYAIDKAQRSYGALLRVRGTREIYLPAKILLKIHSQNTLNIHNIMYTCTAFDVSLNSLVYL